MKKRLFTFRKQTSEDEPNESFSNLMNNDLVGRAVQLANNISDYDLYRRTLQQEFGLRDNQLDEVCDEAMRVIADGVGKPASKPGTPKSPSNNAGERPIDVKKTAEPYRGEIILRGNEIPNFRPVSEPVEKKFVPSFREAWTNLKGYMTYKDAKNNRESTQTAFKDMWKGEVNKSYFKKGFEQSKDIKEGDVIIVNGKKKIVKKVEVINHSLKFTLDDGTYVTPGDWVNTKKSHPDPSDNPENRYPEDKTDKPDETKKANDLKPVKCANCGKVRFYAKNPEDMSPNDKYCDSCRLKIEEDKKMGKAISKSLTNMQKQLLTEQLVDEFDGSQDMNWQVKAKSWLSAKSVAEKDAKEIISEVAKEFVDGDSETTKAIRTATGAQRYNNKMDRVFSEAKKLEQERLKQGKEPNPSLTSPEEAKKYGWEINGRDVKRIKSMDGEISTKAINKAISEMLKTLEHEEKGGPGRGPRPGGGSGSKKPASLDDVRSKAKKLFSSKTNDKKAFDQLVEEFEERGIDVGDISNIMDEIGFKSSY